MSRLNYPAIIAGMRNVEFDEFCKWLCECCGVSFELLDSAKAAEAAICWYDELNGYPD